jgi:hypothetical protein
MGFSAEDVFEDFAVISVVFRDPKNKKFRR